MSDWRVGDLAVCVKRDAWSKSYLKRPYALPEYGKTYLVVGMAVSQVGLCLWLDGMDFDQFLAAGFRKVQPDKHEACEAEFITLLKRNKVPTEQPA